MKKNPLIPFALIAFLGILMMVVLSYQGLSKADELAKEKAHGGGAVVAQNPEEVVKSSCAGCHGGNLEGGVGPKLSDVGARLSKEQIQEIIVNGQGNMPGGLVDAEQAGKVSEWLAKKK